MLSTLAILSAVRTTEGNSDPFAETIAQNLFATKGVPATVAINCPVPILVHVNVKPVVFCKIVAVGAAPGPAVSCAVYTV